MNAQKDQTRRPLIAGNWKLHHTQKTGGDLASAVASAASEPRSYDLVIAPPFTALAAVREALGATAGSNEPIGLSAQDVHWEPQGAFTGEVSVPMLQDLGCTHCIVGHSERRQIFGETDAQVARKVAALLQGGLQPIVCIGESQTERADGKTLAVVLGQLEHALSGLPPADMARCAVAYEPVWAIGTGLSATPEDAQSVHAAIRACLAKLATESVASAMRVVYGGSVKPSNAAALLAQADIDGALVGGASLRSEDFLAIARAATA